MASLQGKRKPGELAVPELNKDGSKKARPGADRTGRPPDRLGHRVGVGGRLTPDAKKNNRPEGQVILRRDATAPARLRMALAVEREGVKDEKDLQKLLPETWKRLEKLFARFQMNL